jgi:hypothetical protein
VEKVDELGGKNVKVSVLASNNVTSTPLDTDQLRSKTLLSLPNINALTSISSPPFC